MTRGKRGRGGKGCRQCRVAFAAIRNGDSDPRHENHLRTCHHWKASGREIPMLGQTPRRQGRGFWPWKYP